MSNNFVTCDRYVVAREWSVTHNAVCVCVGVRESARVCGCVWGDRVSIFYSFVNDVLNINSAFGPMKKKNGQNVIIFHHTSCLENKT